MQVTYESLGKLTIQHDFFGESAAPLEVYVYSENGQPHQQIRVREQARDFHLFAPAGMVTGERVLLGIHLEDPLFFNYTGLQFHRDQILYVYPRMGEPVMKTATYDWLPKFGRIAQFPMSAEDFQAIQQITLQHLEGGAATGLPIVKGAFSGSYLIDLANYPSGGYQINFQLATGNTLRWNFFALGDSQLGKHVVIVSAYLQPGYAQFVHFPTRKAFWRYNIIGLSEADWPSAMLSAQDGTQQAIPFKKVAERAAIPGGQSAYQWISEEAIPFSQKPEVEVRLTTPQFVSGIRLPDASSEQLKRQRIDSGGEEVYLAEVFMYL